MKIVKHIIAVIIMMATSQAISQTKPVIQWRIAEAVPGKESALQNHANRLLMDHIKDLSYGRLVISASPVNTLASQDIWQMIGSDEYQIGHLQLGLEDKNSDMSLFSSTLFGMVPQELYSWFYEGGGLELMHQAHNKYDVISFPGGNLGNQMGGWFRKPVQSLDDLRGLRMSSKMLEADIARQLGVTLVTLKEEEYLNALKNGSIDAIESNGPAIDITRDLHELAPYYYTGLKPSTELQFVVNKKAYTDLPADLQQALTAAMRLAAYDTYIYMTYINAIKLRELSIENPQVKIQGYPRPVISAIRKLSRQNLQRTARQGSDLTRKIVESMTQHQDQIRVWTRIGDQAFLNNIGL